MIAKPSEYEKLFLQPIPTSKSSKISTTTLILTMVLLTAVGASIFTALRIFISIPIVERSNMIFLSQTHDPHHDCYIITISILIPRDLIENRNFTEKICHEFRDEIEDGFSRLNDDREIYADFINLKIQNDMKSIEVYYRVKFMNGKLEDDGEIANAVYNGWGHFEEDFFKFIDKFRLKLKMESEKYEITGSENETELKFERHEVNSDESTFESVEESYEMFQ